MSDTLIFTGRRKTSVARVIMKSGTGVITVNKRPVDQFFTDATKRDDIYTPFRVTETEGKYDVAVNVDGGGTTGQVEAARLAIAKALLNEDPEYRLKLKPLGLLTRDPRMVERKKYGRPKARKRFQFSKR